MAAEKSTPSGAPLSLDHVSMMVPDIGAGVAWYQDKLGAELLDRWDNPDIGMEWAKLALGDFILELVTRPGLSPDAVRGYGYHHLAITVPDCDALVDELQAKGVELMSPPRDFDRHSTRWSFVKDNFGNIIEIVSALPQREG